MGRREREMESQEERERKTHSELKMAREELASKEMLLQKMEGVSTMYAVILVLPRAGVVP